MSEDFVPSVKDRLLNFDFDDLSENEKHPYFAVLSALSMKDIETLNKHGINMVMKLATRMLRGTK